MTYTPLTKIYYSNPTDYLNEYESRFNAPRTKHFGIKIKPLKASESYPAFLCYPEELDLLISKINTAMKNFIAVQDKIPPVAIKQFAFYSLIEEIQSTNEIEGVRSTRREILEAHNYSGNRTDIRLLGLVSKYKQILRNQTISFKTVEDIRTFYDEFVLSEVAEKDYPDGEIFRKDGVVVKSPTGSDKPIHNGVFPEDKIISHLQSALAILHDDSMSILVRCAVFHYLFAYIHPFYDGNGRTDRFITSYFLAKETGPIIALRLSILIKQHRTKYYKLFDSTNGRHNRGDLTPFVLGFLEFVLETIENTSQTLFEQNELFTALSMALYKKLGLSDKEFKIYYILLQATLFAPNGITAKNLARVMEISKSTVQKRLKKLPKEHIEIDIIHREYHYTLNLENFDLLNTEE